MVDRLQATKQKRANNHFRPKNLYPGVRIAQSFLFTFTGKLCEMEIPAVAGDIHPIVLSPAVQCQLLPLQIDSTESRIRLANPCCQPIQLPANSTSSIAFTQLPVSS